METNTNPLPQIAKSILGRLNVQYPKKGARRDNAALEMAMGAYIALQVMEMESSAASMFCTMTAVRGASWIEEMATKA